MTTIFLLVIGFGTCFATLLAVRTITRRRIALLNDPPVCAGALFALIEPHLPTGWDAILVTMPSSVSERFGIATKTKGWPSPHHLSVMLHRYADRIETAAPAAPIEFNEEHVIRFVGELSILLKHADPSEDPERSRILSMARSRSGTLLKWEPM